MNEQTNVTDLMTTEKVNKSNLILATFKTLGLNKPANDVIDAVKVASGVDVTVSLVNNLRCRLRKAKDKRKAARLGKTQPVTEPTVTEPGDDPLAKLFAVKEFAAKIGGLTELKTLVDKLERLAA